MTLSESLFLLIAYYSVVAKLLVLVVPTLEGWPD